MDCYSDMCRSGANIKEMRILVDLDAEKGRPPRPGREADTCYCIIKQTKQVRLAVIDAYLKKQISFDNSVLEAISKLLWPPSPTLEAHKPTRLP